MQTSASVSPATLTSGSGAKLASLEGLRGILALTVCAGHLGLNNLGAQFGFQVRFDAAVDVFFAISGFVLSRAYYLERRLFRDLAVSRFARLYPLHLLTMLWCLLLSYNGRIEWTQFWQNIFLIQNVGLPPNRWAYNFPSWSISVEMAISLAFYFVMRRDRAWLPPLLLATGISMSAFATSSGLTPALNHGGVFNSGLLRGFSGFCLGAAAYLLTVHAPEACRQIQPRWLTCHSRPHSVLPDGSLVVAELRRVCRADLSFRPRRGRRRGDAGSVVAAVRLARSGVLFCLPAAHSDLLDCGGLVRGRAPARFSQDSAAAGGACGVCRVFPAVRIADAEAAADLAATPPPSSGLTPRINPFRAACA